MDECFSAGADRNPSFARDCNATLHCGILEMQPDVDLTQRGIASWSDREAGWHDYKRSQVCVVEPGVC